MTKLITIKEAFKKIKENGGISVILEKKKDLRKHLQWVEPKGVFVDFTNIEKIDEDKMQGIILSGNKEGFTYFISEKENIKVYL